MRAIETPQERAMAEQVVVKRSGIGFFGLLAVAFIVLKLTGVIAWSWWWVLAPLWIGPAIALAIFVLAAIVLGIDATRGNK